MQSQHSANWLLSVLLLTATLSVPRTSIALTPREWGTITIALNNIKNPPPASITWNNGRGGSVTTSMATVYNDLSRQLNSGRMDSRVMGPGMYAFVFSDGRSSTHGDQMFISSQRLAQWGSGGGTQMKYLEETLIHEWVHKQQTPQDRWPSGLQELQACNAEMAYKDSINMSHSDPEYQVAMWNAICAMQEMIDSLSHTISHRRYFPTMAYAYEYFLMHDTNTVAGVDSLISFQYGDTAWSTYSLAPFRASDMMIYESYPTFPPDSSLAVICGGFLPSGIARIAAYIVCDGQVVSPYLFLDFGPPSSPPAFFYSMSLGRLPSTYHVLDTVNHQILTLQDTNGDSIPDLISGTYAAASWPGFGVLGEARGIDKMTHRSGVMGLLVNLKYVHIPEHLSPYDRFWFLPDYNLDNMADACLELPLWEFVEILPVIQAPLPWAGENSVSIYATWQHNIAVYACDSLGQAISELLGTVNMVDSVDAVCTLTRSLVADEYVIAHDLISNEQLLLATKVINPVPQHLTIACVADGTVRLAWSAVEGASFYRIYASLDAQNFFFTGFVTPETHFIMPPSGEPKQFYRVTAFR
jgi:hypothetical protein